MPRAAHKPAAKPTAPTKPVETMADDNDNMFKQEAEPEEGPREDLRRRDLLDDDPIDDDDENEDLHNSRFDDDILGDYKPLILLTFVALIYETYLPGTGHHDRPFAIVGTQR